MHNFLTFALSSEGGGFNPLDPENGGVAVWTWLIFLLSLPFIWKVVMGPVTKALEARDEAAAKAIVDAQAAKSGAEAARAEVEAKLAEARTQAARIVEEARVRAEVREKEILETARREAQATSQRAQAEILAAQDKALGAIRAQVVNISMSAAGSVLRRKVDADDDRRLVEEIVAGAGSGKGMQK
jgi:F-type H+-transporting ATPase subunit b